MSGRRNRWRVYLLAALCVALATPVVAGKDKKKQSEDEATPSLVWPAPPAPARVRFVAEIDSGEDVAGIRKKSWVERLTGRSEARDEYDLIKPYGVAVREDGKIYVADSAQSSIMVFDRANRSAERLRGSSQFPLFLPIGLVFDRFGRLFVSDSYAGRVVMFNSGGKPEAAIGEGALERPGGMAIDGSRNRLYVADAKLNTIVVFDLLMLKELKRIGGPSTPGEPEPGLFSGPTNLALDSEQRLYVTDTFNCRVQVFDPDGRFLRMWGTRGTQPGNFVRPKGIAVDSQDHIYVADAEFNNFQIFNTEGEILLFVGSLGFQPGQFLLPAGLAIDSRDYIYVTEQRMSGGRMQIFQHLAEGRTADGSAKTADGSER